MMHNEFGHKEVRQIYPWTKDRTLISWSERGLIEPATGASGRGSARGYSYTNLIQIGIIDQLLQYGIPFAIIAAIMKGTSVKEMIEKKDFNRVIWSDRQIVSFETQMDKGPAFVGTVECVKIDDFLADGGQLLFGNERGNVTSAVIVNVKSIKNFVDRQIKRWK